MGIQDRDYWREWYNNRTKYSESAKFRQPAAEDDLTDHAYFKPRRQLSGWPLFLFRFVWYSLVFYSAARLVNRLLT